MKKIIFISLMCWTFFAIAALPPELYMVDPTCPKTSPFKVADWNNYDDETDDGYYAPYGKCISCDIAKGLMLVNDSECKLCPNRIFENGECKLEKCPKNKPFYESYGNWSGCKSCQDEPTFIKKEECMKCSNMHWIEFESHENGWGRSKLGFCAPSKKNKIYHSMNFLTKEGHISGIDGGKFPFESDCNNPHVKNWGAVAVETSKEECSRCPNTYMKNGWCYFK